jgi:hypothetical protein
VKSFRLLIAVTVLLIVALFSGWFGLHSFIRSETFREWISKRVSRSLHVDGHFAPLTWEGSSFKSAGFSAVGSPSSKLRSLQVSNLSANLDLWQLVKGAWVIRYVNAEKVDAVAGKTSTGPIAKPTKQPHISLLPNFLPSELRIEQVYIASANLHWETNRGDRGQFVGTKLTANRKGPDQWEVVAIGGNVQHAAYPLLQLDQAHASVGKDSIVIHDAKALAGRGEISMTGNISLGRQLNARLSSDFSGIDASQALPPDWHIGGKASGQLVYSGDLDRFEHGEVTGTVKITGAAIDMTNFFATLHQLTKFGGLNDVRIDSIEAHLRYQQHQLELSQIHASYQDQIRVEGAGSITPDHLDGRLLIGLSPKILGWIPGAEEKVFTEQRDGLRWTTVNISGTPDQPKEDLTKRLIAAFRDKMTREFKGEARDAVKSLLDMFHQ